MKHAPAEGVTRASAHLPVGFACVPVRTPTLPPATHTNCWLVGQGLISVFDPASPYEDEQRLLARTLQARIAGGEAVERIVLTHHHHDHIAGAAALRDIIGSEIPILAHAETARRIAEDIRIDATLADGERLECGSVTLDTLHTPGHAPGHLAFRSTDGAAVIAGDLVAGVGTILIDPRDGHLTQYLDSLERVRALGTERLLPAHGPVLTHPDAVLKMYVAHRHHRTEQIRTALHHLGTRMAADLVPIIYPELPREMALVGEAQITSHLRYLVGLGLVRREGQYWMLDP